MTECSHCTPAEVVPLIRPGSPADLLVELARDADEISGLVALVRDPDGEWDVAISTGLTRAQVAYALRVLTCVLDSTIGRDGEGR